MKRCIAVLVATLTAASTPPVIRAQDALQHWPGFKTTGLPTVYVRDDTGAEVSGRLLRLDADAIVLLVGDVEQRIEARRVTRIQKRGDSLRNGLLIGTFVGAALGLLAASISDCPGSDPGGRCPGTRLAAFVVGTGTYGALGAGIDALVVGRTTLYEAPAVAPPSGDTPSGGRLAVNMRLRW